MSAPVVGAGVARHYRELTGIWPGEAAGLRQLRPARSTGRLVGLYNAAEAGMEDSGWATVCETHSTLVIHDSLALARSHAADPASWCEACR